MTLNTVLYMVVFLFFFAATEVVKRWKDLRPESTRKVVHMGTSAIACTMPYFISRVEVMILAGLFILLLFVTKRFGLFTSVQGVRRRTVGEFTFPIAAAISAWLFLPSAPSAFIVGFAILGIADTAAQIIGTHWPVRDLLIFGQVKSVGGGVAFVLCAALIYIAAANLLSSDIDLFRLLVAAFVVGLVELSQVFGLDNLFIPPLAGWLWMWVSA